MRTRPPERGEDTALRTPGDFQHHCRTDVGQCQQMRLLRHRGCAIHPQDDLRIDGGSRNVYPIHPGGPARGTQPPPAVTTASPPASSSRTPAAPSNANRRPPGSSTPPACRAATAPRISPATDTDVGATLPDNGYRSNADLVAPAPDRLIATSTTSPTPHRRHANREGGRKQRLAPMTGDLPARLRPSTRLASTLKASAPQVGGNHGQIPEGVQGQRMEISSHQVAPRPSSQTAPAARSPNTNSPPTRSEAVPDCGHPSSRPAPVPTHHADVDQCPDTPHSKTEAAQPPTPATTRPATTDSGPPPTAAATKQPSTQLLPRAIAKPRGAQPTGEAGTHSPPQTLVNALKRPITRGMSRSHRACRRWQRTVVTGMLPDLQR